MRSKHPTLSVCKPLPVLRSYFLGSRFESRLFPSSTRVSPPSAATLNQVGYVRPLRVSDGRVVGGVSVQATLGPSRRPRRRDGDDTRTPLDSDG